MSDAGTIRILCVDDHPLFRQGVAAVLGLQPDLALEEASSAGEAIEKFRARRPDVTLMDLRLPDMTGVDAMIAIRAEFPEARVVILTNFEGDVEIQRALSAGARGYLLKSTTPRDLVGAIRRVHAGQKEIPARVAAQVAEHLGESGLSAREIEVLREVSRGSRNQDIARELGIAEDTVKAHLKHILDKLGAKDRAEAVAIALRRGILRL